MNKSRKVASRSRRRVGGRKSGVDLIEQVNADRTMDNVKKDGLNQTKD